jgi:hypothetical protein
VTSSQAVVALVAQATVTGSRLPAAPERKGSGNEPTTAGIDMAAPHSWRSHQMRSPGCRAVAAAPRPASMPLT